MTTPDADLSTAMLHLKVAMDKAWLLFQAQGKAPSSPATPRGPAPASQTVPKAVASLQRAPAQSGDVPHWGIKDVVEIPQGFTVRHKERGELTVQNVKLMFGAGERPQVGSKDKGTLRDYFDSPGVNTAWKAELPWSMWIGQTWGQLCAEAVGLMRHGVEITEHNCGLVKLTKDNWWSITAFENKQYVHKTMQQAAGLLILCRNWTKDSSAGEGDEPGEPPDGYGLPADDAEAPF